MTEPHKKQKSKAKKTKKKEKKGSMDKNAASNECHEIIDININQLEGASLSLCENKNLHQDDENQTSKDREKQESI